MKKIIAGILILFCAFLIYSFGLNKYKAITFSPETLIETKEDPKPITVTLVGDVMMDRGVKRSIEKNFDGDYGALFSNTAYLKEGDITFANLEGSVAYGGHNVGSIYSFHMDPKSLEALYNTGIDIVSFANNHVGDWSKVAFDESLEHIKSNNILYTGAGNSYKEVISPTIIEKGGLKVGFLASTDVGPNWLEAKEYTSGILLSSDPNLPEVIKEAKQKVDILIVSFHFGNEYSPFNARQTKLAQMAIDNGADVIVGHHPHVIQKLEWYKGKPIFYSLGNFIFDQYFSSYTMEGMVATISIDPKTKEVSLVSQKISPLDKNYIPQPPVDFDQERLVKKTFIP